MAKPRIRSIKPEFATSGDMLRLSDACALFFVLLWPICDDEGKHELDYQGIAAKLGGRWHRGKVKLFVSCLIKSGQLRINSTSTWLQVTQWSHQKIDKPRQPDVLASELQWLSQSDSAKALEYYPPRSDRIGSDSIGSDLLATESKVVAIASTPKSKPKAPASRNNPSFELVQHWKAEFKAVYGNEPIPAGKEWGSAKNLLRFVPLERAKRLITAYLGMKDHWFITKRHSIAVMLDNLDAVNTFLETGNTVNRTQIAQIEKAEASLSQLDRVKKGLL
jgi:hypothetical protein